MTFKACMATDSSELPGLRETKARYEQVVAMARETRCVCNNARDFVVIAREVIDFLLRGDESVSYESVGVHPELRSQHCLIHSPPVAERPWLSEGRR